MAWVVGFHVACTLVTLLQYRRLRERRLLPLALLFALLAAAHSQPDWYAARWLHFAAALAGLVLLLVLSPRPPATR